MKKCNNCQAVVADTANFCHLCGSSEFSPIEAEPVVSAAAEPIPQEPAVQEEPAAPAEPAVQESAAAEGPAGSATVQQAYQEPAAPHWTEMPREPKPRRKPSKGLIIGICAAVVALIAAVAAVVILTNPVRRYMNCIEEDDIEQAFEIYLEDIAGNENRTEKLTETIDSYTTEQLQLFESGEISYDLLTSRLYAIQQSCPFNEQVYVALDEAWQLNYYRETYAAAEEAMADGDYATAVSLYSEVAGMDFENGEDAVDKLAQATESYRDSILNQVQQLIDEHSYSSAQMLIEDALWVLPNDTALYAAMEDCRQAEYDYAIDCLIEQALAYTGSNDYVGAITYLDEQIGYYPDEVRLQQTREECLAAFEKYVIEESFRVATAGDFAHAYSLTASGLSYFTSATVTELQQIYVSHIPVNLGDMEIFKNSSKGGSWASYTNDVDKYLEDKFGGTYAHSVSIGCGSLTYLLNFKYQTFTGTVGFPKGLEADSARESATLTIYGDGQEIAVYRDVTDTTKPESFTLDVSAYEQITLTWECEGYNIWEDWGDFATIFDGVLTPIPLDLPDSVS